MASAGQGILPIREISAYHNRWTIRARVTNKGSLRTFTKGANGGGKVFGVELLDAEGGEIRASFFNQAADLFFDKLIVGKIFNLSRGQAKVANRQYNPCNHRYELTFDKDALVEEATDEGEQIQKVKFNFVDVKSVRSKSLPCRVDLCGVVTAARPLAEIQTKDGRSSVKRDITVADDSGASIDVILWGEHAKLENEKFECQPSVALKGVLIKEWNGGRGGSLSESGTILLAPELPEAVKVREWWVTGGSSQAIAGLSVSGGAGMGSRPPADVRVKSLAEVRAACDRLGSEAEMYTTVAWLGSVQLRKQGEKAPLLTTRARRPRSSAVCPAKSASTRAASVSRAEGKAKSCAPPGSLPLLRLQRQYLLHDLSRGVPACPGHACEDAEVGRPRGLA